MVFSWDLGINGDIGNIVFSWNVSGLGLSGRCPVQLEFDIFDPSDELIDKLAVPDFSVTPNCPELGTKSQTFWVDSRSVPNYVCHVVCYDRMSRVDTDFSTDWDWKSKKTMPSNNVLMEICRICGFDGHSMSGGAYGGLQYINFTQSVLAGKSCGEILDMISEAMVGVWVCLGKTLHLLCFGNVSDGFVVNSSEHTEIEYQGRTKIIGLVMKNSSDGKTFSFGTTSGNGYVVQVENEFVSADLAGVVWLRLNGYQYTAWNCEKADITTKGFNCGGLLQFAYSGGSGSLESPLFPRNVRYSVDSTGIYFSGGCPAVDEWNYKSKLEREKIGIGKAVGNTTISENGDIIFLNLNNEGGGLDGRDNGISVYVNQN